MSENRNCSDNNNYMNHYKNKDKILNDYIIGSHNDIHDNNMSININNNGDNYMINK